MSRVVLRSATWRDAEKLLEWRNDPLTRQNSTDSKAVTHEEHLTWLGNTFSDTTCKLYVAMADDTPVGSIRADATPQGWELSWTIAPSQRGRGFGKTMVAMLVAQLHGRVCARIRRRNLASVRVAQQVGMRMVGSEGDMTIWEVEK